MDNKQTKKEFINNIKLASDKLGFEIKKDGYSDFGHGQSYDIIGYQVTQYDGSSGWFISKCYTKKQAEALCKSLKNNTIIQLPYSYFNEDGTTFKNDGSRFEITKEIIHLWENDIEQLKQNNII